ncbi:HDIG domain protein [Marvinbryantia formatexigens DSM 14469]|uniref:HDIG domain protein n=1 Tax=Marvinbryantia formatexigens DSM 14469 TaxID=478749 RepID=C6LLD2_9FIRM|nr:HD domain-containing protein [Marvinbryantia formatexigens]EET58555.1 HDIG domain protein [Marvinbryantia formatexigens DSM 14469]UWO24885.1 HD domain-containing protein [Marvinbryantia formatexigens DSM 14469]SDG77520.1 HD domain-containing protein [Marvinbryantia formatexigens]
MERVNAILKNETYQSYLREIAVCEETRIFCRHNMGHFLDVARIAQLLNLEEAVGVPKELIYAAALLHDIGRHLQYREKIPHEQASAHLAPEILRESGFSETETEEILEAIRRHRDASVRGEKNLAGLIYRADKLSRSCFACPAEPQCDWKEEKKNRRIVL